MRLPDFLVIGARKAGTTSLHHYLNQHPQIFLPQTKELCFFALEGESINYCGPGDRERWTHCTTTLDRYCASFKEATSCQLIGEVCPLYLTDAVSARRIYSLIPSVKLIAILRNPIERAWSGYSQLKRDKRERLNLRAAIAAIESRKSLEWAPA